MQFSKRILALLLALMMVCAMLPMTAGAEEAETFPFENSAELLLDAAENVDLTEATEATEAEEEEVEASASDVPAVIATCDVHTPEVIPAVEPTCHSYGYTAGVKCSVCGEILTAPEKIAMTAHTLATQPAKNPTWTVPGWAAFQYCTVDDCSYSTQQSIPALGEPTIDNYAEFVQNLYYLELLAGQYVADRPGKDPAELVIKYIRTGVDRYNSGSWQIMAGYEDAEFARFVRLTEDQLNQQMPSVDQYLKITGLKNVENFMLPEGVVTDFGHMFGTIDISYSNKNSQNHADVAGWAGDLVDLLSCVDYHGLTGSVEDMTKVISEKYLMTKTCSHADAFGYTDMYGDLDGLYFVDLLKNNEYTPGAMSAVMQMYFTTDLSLAKRCEYFLESRLEGVGTQSNIRQAVYEAYMGNKMISTLENTREWNSSDLSDMRKAACNAYADLMWKLGGDYVELVDNKYYEIFQSTDTVLAPGITQEVNYAQSSDGKQMVFYIATIDLNREDVEVYANYKDNDPTEWGMQRVQDQAQAAQDKYGNPDSPYYIKNFNVIASINADGFAMTSTGAPSGLLVMNGVEYNGINKNGFFGITKDGKAVIGTTEEYNTIYKDQMRDAIGGFGTTLIKDGKINVKPTDNYAASRASRTAVGITRSGKVVFMVLDGRQEPFSCGGSMEEIAQIMLEAGCVHAINLDGGGSSTFVSKQEGQDTLSVINRPSDGFARSVGPTLYAVSTAPSSTAFDHAVIESEYTVSTIGTPVQLTAKGVSATGNAAELPEGTTWVLSNTRWGTITEDGVFTGSRNGTVTVYLMLGDVTLGQISLRVANPTGLYFDRNSVDAVYGQTVEIPVIATYEGKKVAVSDSDLKFSVNKAAAGSFNGRMFTAKESNLTTATVTVALAKNTGVTATINVNLYKQGENSFDFANATSGDRLLAWDRKVTNAITEDGTLYTVVDPTNPMETEYIFAMDMSEIPIPERLADLTYMLPGADQVSSAWGFLLQLAQRVSDMSYVTTTIKFDSRFNVDISEMKVITKYFEVTEVTLDEQTNTAYLKMNWIRQSQAIDPSTANSLCIVNGIKLTPKEDADWGANNQINAVHSGEIAYRIYLRASSLVSFGNKPENQQIYGLYAYQNPDMPSDNGAYFESTYKTFTDAYSLRSSAKSGWQVEEGGYVYYANGQRLTGIHQIDGYYYDFGETGINKGQTKYTGLIHNDGKIYYSLLGQLATGWVGMENGDYYHFNINTYVAMTGVTQVGGHTYTFSDSGVLLRGAFVEDSQGLHYYWAGRKANRQWIDLPEGRYYADTQGNIAFGHAMVKEDATKPIVWWYFDETTGLVVGKSDGFITYQNELYYCEDGVHYYGAKVVDGGIIYCGTYGKVYVNNACYVMEDTRGDTNLQTGFYGTDSKGMIIANGFVKAGGNTYYFTDYVRATGFTKIGDKYYLFNTGNGAMYTDSVQWVGANEYGVAPGYYTFMADGAMFVPDLVGGEKAIVERDGKLYFTIDGVTMKNGLYEKDGEYYYATSTGALACSTTTWINTTDLPSGNGYYSFGADGKLIKTGFVTGSGSTFYYRDLVRVKGFTKIGDDYYLFNAGYGNMIAGRTEWVGANDYGIATGFYTFLADGKMFVPDLVNGEKAIVERDGKLYFTIDGVTLKSGLYEKDGEYYYATSTGALACSTTTWITTTDLPSGSGYYSFGADGKLIKTGFVTGGGSTFYYRDLVRVKGFTKIGDDYYLFNAGYGNLITDRTEWVGANDYGFATGYYTFLADGKMFIPDLVNGEKAIVERNGKLYFTIDGVTLKNGLYELDGEYYYATYGGELACSTTLWITTTDLPSGSGYYSFSADGKLIKTGFVTGGGSTFYYRDLVRVKGFTKIGDDYYMFNAGYGNMISGRTEWVGANDYGFAAGHYTFLSDGKMFIPDLVNGEKLIVEKNGKLYFTIDGVTLKNGLYELDGEYYYATYGGELACSTTTWVNTTDLPAGNGYYSFGADGKLIKTGFVTGGGKTFYYNNLERVKGFTKIGDDYYLFNAGSGEMIAGRTEWVGANNYGIATGFYTFLSDGKMFIPDLVNGEKAIVERDGKLYFTIDGVTLKSGLYEKDGEYYYAFSDGALACSTSVWVTTTELPSGSGYYAFAADGKLVKTGFATGSGKTFYYRDLVRVKGFTQIGDDYYLFNAGSGEMVAGRSEWVSANEYGIAAGRYDFAADGKLILN